MFNILMLMPMQRNSRSQVTHHVFFIIVVWSLQVAVLYFICAIAFQQLNIQIIARH